MRNSSAFRTTTAVIAIAAALALSACARDSRTTGSIQAQSSFARMSEPQIAEEIRKYSARYERNPKDKATGLAFASLLRLAGRDEQSLAVMRKLVIHHPTDNDVLSAYGKALAATGNLKEALAAIERAQRPFEAVRDQPEDRRQMEEADIHSRFADRTEGAVLNGSEY